MKTVLMADPVRYPRMNTDELRETFLLNALYEPGKIHLNYVDLDRAVVGFACSARRAHRAAHRSRPARRLLYRAPRAGRAQHRRRRHHHRRRQKLRAQQSRRALHRPRQQAGHLRVERQIRARHLLSLELSRARRLSRRARPQGRSHAHRARLASKPATSAPSANTFISRARAVASSSWA